MTDRRRFMKTVTGAVAGAGVPVATAGTDARSRAHAPSRDEPMPAAIVVEADLDGAGFGFAADGIRLKGGRPSVTLLIGRGEERRVLRPVAAARKGHGRGTTPLGPVDDAWREWTNGEYRWRLTVGRLARRNGVTLRASFHNGSREPVRLAEFNLCGTPDGGLTCDGDPRQWFLLPINGQLRAGHLGETLLPAAHERWSGFGGPTRRHFPAERQTDGRWRIYDEVATLYSDGGRRGLLIGPVGTLEAHLRLDFRVDAGAARLDVVSAMNDVVVDPGETRESQEVLFLAEPYRDALDALFRTWAAVHGTRLHRGPLTGWCSWYDTLDKIDAAHVVAVADAVREAGPRLRADVIQVDMGYERTWGDWTTNAKFPEGWPPVVDAVRRAGALPGVWLASLAVSNDAGDVRREHPDWFQRTAGEAAISGTTDGKIVDTTSGERYLDPTHPGAQAFLRDIVRRMRAEGFSYFKIDYNEISHDCRFHDPKKTRLQAFRDLYRLYREAIGDESYLLACCEMTRAVMGHADAIRVGWDSRAFWDFAPGKPPICLLEALRCVGQSALANGVCFANDPDVTYLKPRDTLTAEELRTWHGFVGLLGGTVMISEPLDKPEYRALAREYEILVPPVPDKGWSHHGGTDRDHQQFGFVAHRAWGDFGVVQLYNVGEQPAPRSLDVSCLDTIGERFHVFSFWDEKYLGLGGPGWTTSPLPPHGAVVLRLTPPSDDPATPVLVGSTLHIGMGSAEIEGLAASPGEMVVRLTDAGARDGALFVHSARPLPLATAEGCTVRRMTVAAPAVWRIDVTNRTGRTQTIRLTAT